MDEIELLPGVEEHFQYLQAVANEVVRLQRENPGEIITWELDVDLTDPRHMFDRELVKMLIEDAEDD